MQYVFTLSPYSNTAYYPKTPPFHAIFAYSVKKCVWHSGAFMKKNIRDINTALCIGEEM